MPVLDVGADILHFFDEGSGTPVVFIHGSCGSGAQWKRLSAVLQEDYRPLSLDLFGCGQSEPWPIEREWTVDNAKTLATTPPPQQLPHQENK